MTLRLDSSQYLTWGLSLLVSNPCLIPIASLSALKSHTLIPVSLSTPKIQLRSLTSLVFTSSLAAQLTVQLTLVKQVEHLPLEYMNTRESLKNLLTTNIWTLVTWNHYFHATFASITMTSMLRRVGCSILSISVKKANLLDLLEVLEINKASSNDNVVCLNDQLRHSSTPFFRSLNF